LQNFVNARTVVRYMSVRLSVCVLMLTGVAAAGQGYLITPTSINFGSCSVGIYLQRTIQVTNVSSSDITVNAFTVSPSQFQLTNGWAPATIHAGLNLFFTLRFFPDAAGSFTGQAIVTVQGTPTTVALSGTGTIANGVAGLNVSQQSFDGVSQGTLSTSRYVTLTNTGSGSFSLQSVTTDAPFTVKGFTQAITLNPGNSIQLSLRMWGGIAGSYTGELVFGFDSLPPKGVSLTGSVKSSNSFIVISNPLMPAATVNSPYAAVFAAHGGEPPYTWKVVKGSHLPTGLSLSSDGVLSGNLDPSVTPGTYRFGVKATDSGFIPKTSTLGMTFTVDAMPTSTSVPGEDLLPNCNGAYFPNLITPLIALTDLGTGVYIGQEGGLYPDGSNVRPPGHDSAGVLIANGIQPLDGKGNPDPNGKYALLGLGMSETQDDFDQFMIDAKADPATNSHLVFVNGAQTSTVAAVWADPSAAQWNTVMNYLLPQNHVSAQQVVAAWVKDVDEPSGTFPSDEVPTQLDLEGVARTLHSFFPNLKLAYFSSRIYGGYCNGDPVNSEPHSYESGFAVKWLIADQISGDPYLNFDPNAGPVVAPWIAWGPYDWANGLYTRHDGEVWTCQEFKDGIHPSNPVGRQRDANMLLNFFKTDSTTAAWFVQPSGK
jgi:hypothetical protein